MILTPLRPAASYEPKSSGWEANKRGAVRPRHMDLGAFLDPRQLAESAVDLNLRLMRWRVADGLDLDRLAATSCLLLGAGDPKTIPRIRVQGSGLPLLLLRRRACPARRSCKLG